MAELLTIAEFARRVSVSRRTVERWVASGRLAVVLLNGTRTAGSVRIDSGEADRFIAVRAGRVVGKGARGGAILLFALTLLLYGMRGCSGHRGHQAHRAHRAGDGRAFALATRAQPNDQSARALILGPRWPQ
jgi:excisionase family DNA binding protein